MNIADLPTPALLLDADIFEANIIAMAEFVARAGKHLRPHVKAHKCVEVARCQMKAGAVGVCVATVAEAEAMVHGGVGNVLLTSPVADSRKCARLAALATASGSIAAVVDHADQVRLYSAAARAAGVKLDLLVDLDLGDHRTGIRPGNDAVALALLISSDPNLRFSGLQAYSVRGSHLQASEDREAFAAATLAQAEHTSDLLAEKGVEVHEISVGSTASYRADAALPYVTELQAGSYPFMDVAFARLGGIDFGHALTVVATVVSANQADRVTVDAGFKAFATDRPFGPDVMNIPGARYEWAGDEFGYVFLNGSAPLGVGDRVRFIPPHCDPTVNLYDHIHVCRGERVEEVWPVFSRQVHARQLAH